MRDTPSGKGKIMWIFNWFDANCAWIYNNMCIFNWMWPFYDEAPVGGQILKCILMGFWYFFIVIAPLVIVVRGVGYIIGGWTGMLPAFFVDDDD